MKAQGHLPEESKSRSQRPLERQDHGTEDGASGKPAHRLNTARVAKVEVTPRRGWTSNGAESAAPGPPARLAPPPHPQEHLGRMPGRPASSSPGPQGSIRHCPAGGRGAGENHDRELSARRLHQSPEAALTAAMGTLHGWDERDSRSDRSCCRWDWRCGRSAR